MISSSQQGFLDTEKGMEVTPVLSAFAALCAEPCGVSSQDVLVYVPDEKLQQKIRG